MGSRYDMYNNVHKGLRRALCTLLVDAGHASELTDVRARWLALVETLRAHHQHEDVYIGPHLARIAPPLFADMERDHHALQLQLAAVSVSADDEPRVFYRTLARFVASYLAHMADEEGAYNEALQGAYTDRDLMAIENELVASIAPPAMGAFMTMMLPAMNGDERFDLLAGMRAGAPPEVFAGMRELASRVLDAAAWRELEARLC